MKHPVPQTTRWRLSQLLQTLQTHRNQLFCISFRSPFSFFLATNILPLIGTRFSPALRLIIAKALDEADDLARVLRPGQRLMSCAAKDGRHVARALRVWHRATVMVVMMVVRRRSRRRVLRRRSVYCLCAAGSVVVVIIVIAAVVAMIVVVVAVAVVVVVMVAVVVRMRQTRTDGRLPGGVQPVQ